MFSPVVITVSTWIVARLAVKNPPLGSQLPTWRRHEVGMKARLGKLELEIESKKPITLVYKDPKITEDLDYAGRIRLDFATSLSHLTILSHLHPETEKYVRIVFPDYRSSWDLDWIRESEGSGFKHVVGRIDYTLRMQDAGAAFVWVYPEASLHPSAQLNLADALLALISRGKGEPPLPLNIKRKPKVPL